MTQKIVIKMYMNDDKTRSKALKTTVSFLGVESAALKGEKRDEVEVIGEEIDAVMLTRALRKKVAQAELLSVGEHTIENDTNNNSTNDKDNVATHSPVIDDPHEAIVWAYPEYPVARYNSDNNVDPCCIIM